MIYFARKKIISFIIIFSLSSLFFAFWDMTKKQACKLENWIYEDTNLSTIWKPYIEYNKIVKNSYEKKTVDVDWFYKSDWFVFYIANFQIQDMTYTSRSNLFSYNCKKNSIKQLSTMSFGKWSYFESRVVYWSNTDSLIFNKYENSQDSYYSIFSKVKKTNTKLDIKTFKNYSLINQKLSPLINQTICNNYDKITIKDNFKWYIECGFTNNWSWNTIKFEIDIKNKEFLFTWN